MSINLTNTSGYALGTGNTDLWLSQASASFSFLFRIAADADLSQLVNLKFMGGQYGNRWNAYLRTVSGSTIGLNVSMNGASHQVSPTVSILPGVVYHVVGTWTSGAQGVYINGVSVASTAYTETTDTAVNRHFQIFGTPATGAVEIADVVIWNGYALTLADILAIRDGTSDPFTIGTSAIRIRWKLDGPTGSSISTTDSAVKNLLGSSTYDLATFTGTGSGVYTPQLAFTPSIAVTPTVLTSGSIVRFEFAVASTGAVIIPSQVVSSPTIAVNGTSLGTLLPIDLGGTCSTSLFRIPGGVILAPSDVVTYSAPAGWAITTGYGLSVGATNAPVENCSGRSAFGTDALAKTLKPGINFSIPAYWTYSSVLKNWACKVNKWSGATVFDRNGNGTMQATTDFAVFASDNAGTCISPLEASPQPPVTLGATGVYAVGWDDRDAANNYPTVLTLSASGGVSLTELTACRNNGVNGVGKVRLYSVTRNHFNGGQINLNLSCSTMAPKLSNVLLLPPGSFSYTPGEACVLNEPDPLALDPALIARFPNGLGTIRGHDATFQASGEGSGEYEPEDLRYPTDLALGLHTYYRVGCSTLRPWDPVASPYIYSSHFGQTYQATLGAAINDLGSLDAKGRLVSTITVTDAATAPIVIGQRLTIDSEDMGVLDVNGTAVTVRRGSRSTTPATHTSGVGTLGSVTVSYRQPISMATMRPNAIIAEIVTATQHGLATGPYYYMSNDAAWGTQTTTDGAAFSLNGYSLTIYVTGPNTFLTIRQGTPAAGPYTMTATTSLDPAKCLIIKDCPTNCHPIEIFPKLASQLGANIYVNIPVGCNDDLVDAMARRIRDAMPAGRKVYLEYGDEPWNFAAPFGYFFAQTYHVSYLLYGPTVSTDKAWAIDRTSQICQRVKAIFNEGGRNRGGEIHAVFNHQATPTNGGVTLEMDYAGANNRDIDTVVIGPYTGAIDNSAATMAAYRNATTAEACDLWINSMWYGVGNNPNAILRTCLTHSASVAAYNTKYGKSAILCGYEGGDQDPWPNPGLTLVNSNRAMTLAANVGAADSTVTLASGYAAKLAVGDDLIIVQSPFGSMKSTDEWVRITAINGDVLTVDRGLYDGSAARAHTTAEYVLTDFFLRGRDLEYHPNWRICFKDFIAILQRAGLVDWCRYTYNCAWTYAKAWGTYTNATQMPGKGDGSDGKADNRLCLAQRGLANSKPAGVVQDVANVSVVGQGINEWMAEAQAGGVPIPPRSLKPTAKKFAPRPRFR